MWDLIHGDCIEYMRGLQDASVYCTVTDIPYGVVSRESNGLRNFDKANADIETFSLDPFVEQVARVTEGSIYVWCSTEQVSELRSRFIDQGMSTRLCIWEKSNPSPANGQHLWLSSVECCVFARQKKAYFARHCESPVWRGAVQRKQLHPTQKPVWLMAEAIMASAPEKSVVFDPCAGSCSTGVAALENNRRFLGVEADAEFYQVGHDRLSAILDDEVAT